MSIISYTLTFEDKDNVQFDIDLERSQVIENTSALPVWTQLTQHQCPNCPLSAAHQQHCPAAADMTQIVHHFSHVASHKPVHVHVKLLGRAHTLDTDVQSALQSLLGLLLATSACPILSKMKGPARLHMPFATVDETLFRMTGAYFLGQYRRSRQGLQPDWSLRSLADFYDQVQIVNQHLKKRLDEMVHDDANLNAIVSLMGMAMLVNFSLDQELENLHPYRLCTGDHDAPHLDVQVKT